MLPRRFAQGERSKRISFLSSMTRLVDKSMVVTYEKGNTTRYRLLETIRQYATEKLAESADREALAGKHAEYFTKMAEQIESRLMSADEVYWLDHLDLDHDNVRIALGWCARSQSPVGVRLAGAMWRFWLTRGHWTEGRRWLSQMIDAFPDAEGAARAKAILGAGALAFNQRDHDAATRLLDESVALFEKLGDFRNQAWAFFYLGWMANDRGNPAQAVEMLERGLRLFSTLSDKQGIAHTRLMLGLVCFFRGDASAARPHRRSEPRHQQGDPRSPGNGVVTLSHIHAACPGGSRGGSRPPHRRKHINIGDPRGQAEPRLCHPDQGPGGPGHRRHSQREQSREGKYGHISRVGRRVRHLLGMSFLAAVMLAEKNADSAFHLAGAVASYRERTGVAFPALVGSYLARVESTRRDLGNAADQAFAEGYGMDLEQAVAYALQLN